MERGVCPEQEVSPDGVLRRNSVAGNVRSRNTAGWRTDRLDVTTVHEDAALGQLRDQVRREICAVPAAGARTRYTVGLMVAAVQQAGRTSRRKTRAHTWGQVDRDRRRGSPDPQHRHRDRGPARCCLEHSQGRAADRRDHLARCSQPCRVSPEHAVTVRHRCC